MTRGTPGKTSNPARINSICGSNLLGQSAWSDSKALAGGGGHAGIMDVDEAPCAVFSLVNLSFPAVRSNG
jgi:hypothetical protein